ncbi:MAG: hypothetical protein LIO74_11755 [Ruminococcus sp.]|nr:hypothetical protein [Ruminococcus sp.]
MNCQNLDPNQVNALLDTAGKKLGIPPEKLKTALESGKYDKILGNLNQKDSAALQKVLQNPKLMEKLMHSPQAKALYEKLSK